MMNSALYLFAVTTLLAAGLAAISIHAPRRLALKLCALLITALFLPSMYLSLHELLGRPKPLELGWGDKQELADTRVLAYDLEEGKAIYLWLKGRDTAGPRYYRLPWHKELAEQLHRAQRAAQQAGTQVRMSGSMDRNSDDSEQIFYAEPQRALPPKEPIEQQLPVTADPPAIAAGVPAASGVGAQVEAQLQGVNERPRRWSRTVVGQGPHPR